MLLTTEKITDTTIRHRSPNQKSLVIHKCYSTSLKPKPNPASFRIHSRQERVPLEGAAEGAGLLIAAV